MEGELTTPAKESRRGKAAKIEKRLALLPRTKLGPKLPRHSHSYLCGPALRLLLFFQRFPIGEPQVTTYDEISHQTKMRSSATIAKAMKELLLVGVIKSYRERIGGKVAGINVTFMGFPEATPEIAREHFLKSLQKQFERIENEILDLTEGEE